MGLEKQQREQFRSLRQSIIRAYIDAVRAERNGAPNQLVAAQAILDFQDLGIRLTTETPIQIPEAEAQQVDFKGFKLIPASRRIESIYHQEPLVLMPTEYTAMARFIRAKGSILSLDSFINPNTGEVLTPGNARVIVKTLRGKLDDHMINFRGRKSRRFIHTIKDAGYLLDPIEFKPS